MKISAPKAKRFGAGGPHRRSPRCSRRSSWRAAAPARGRTRSPSSGFGTKASAPVAIESAIASPIARPSRAPSRRRAPGGSTGSEIFSTVRQRLRPSARAPSRQGAGTRAQRVGEDRDHERRDHHREHERFRAGRSRPGAGTTVEYRVARSSRDEVLLDERREHEQPEQPPDDRGNGGQDPDDRLDDARDPARRELGDEDRREDREEEPDQRSRRPSSAACRRSPATRARAVNCGCPAGCP